MAKRRMRKKGDDGLWAVHGIVRESLERLWKGEQLPSLSQILVELLNGDSLTTASKPRVTGILHLLKFQRGYESQLATRLRSKD